VTKAIGGGEGSLEKEHGLVEEEGKEGVLNEKHYKPEGNQGNEQ